ELILQKIDEICKRRNLTYKVDKLFKSNATPCSVNMLECIEKSFIDLDLEPFKLYSGAGHDAQEIAKISDMGMVFVRCIEGISHNPQEDVHIKDLDIACKLFLQILDNFS
ncbi:MAG: M20/M25/M40 family metallo-hydrolase, partial [Peptostreptococcaceae bacterium]